MNNENRIAIVAVPEEDVFALILNGVDLEKRAVVCRYIKGVPKDAALVSIHYDYAWRAFMFMLRHESFDRVQRGSAAPIISGEFGDCHVAMFHDGKES